MEVNVLSHDVTEGVPTPRGGMWVADTSGDEGATFLLSISRNGDHIGWKVGKLSAVLDSISDQAYASAIGEDADDVTVFVLTSVAPVPVRIESKGHEGAGFVEHVIRWCDPLYRARDSRGDRFESGYTKILDF